VLPPVHQFPQVEEVAARRPAGLADMNDMLRTPHRHIGDDVSIGGPYLKGIKSPSRVGELTARERHYHPERWRP